MHAYSTVATFIQARTCIKSEALKVFMNFSAMWFTLVVTMEVAKTLNNQVGGSDDSVGTVAFNNWLRLELTLTLAIIVSCSVFLLFRAVTKIKISSEKHIDPDKILPTVDSLIASKFFINCWMTEFCTMILASVVIFIHSRN